MLTMRELESEVEKDVEEWWTDGGWDVRYPNEDMDSIVDSAVPIWTSGILEVAIDEPWVVYDQPELEYTSPLEGIKYNIYEHLRETAYNKLSELKDEYEDLEVCEQCGEKIQDPSTMVDVAPEGEFSFYVHAKCEADYEADNPLEVPEEVGSCEGCGDSIFASEDIIIEEEDGEERYYHPACSPTERQIADAWAKATLNGRNEENV